MLLCAVAYLGLWPVPIEPVAWRAPMSAGYSAEFAANQKLDQHEKINLGGLSGPEAVALNANGDVYATTHEGWIVRWRAGQVTPERWVELGGRPLGIAFDANGDLWVANAYVGLQVKSISVMRRLILVLRIMAVLCPRAC